ncbi:MAG: tetratricopeptide repeat protein [Anaerolineae bacterium]|nr:tetratricopeptide repeat protein [Anaerolineae bacterium]
MSTELAVFISSKMQELAPERQAIRDLLPTLNRGLITLHAWVFEDDAPASDDTIRQVYLEALQRSALYIGLFWNQYGEWTIDEFDRATEWGIDRHIYVKNVDTHARAPRLQTFLDEHSGVTTGITAKWFTTLDELREAVTQSLEVWLKKRLTGRSSAQAAVLAEVPTSIPRQPDRLIGRDALRDQVNTLLDQGERVLLYGFGGMGKTALAAAVAAGRIADGKGPVLWLEAGRADAGTLFEALALPFGAQQAIAGQTGDAQLAAMRALLAGAGVKLVVLDNAWDGQALNRAAQAVPDGLPLLVTSRQHYPLRKCCPVGELGPDEALDLLNFYADRDLSADPQAGDLCKTLGYHAYALEIAAKNLLVDNHTPGELLARIADAPYALAMPEGFAAEGRESVGALLEVSLDALDDEARAVFLAVGALFAPGATPELLALVTERDRQAIDNALTRLARRGLAERVQATKQSAAFFRVHDLAYSYADAQASETDRARALDACLAYTGRYNTPDPANFAALRPELDNCLGAAAWAMEAGRYKDVERFAWNLYANSRVLDYSGLYTQAITLLALADDAAARQGSRRDQGAHLGHLGTAYANLGQYQRAIEHFQQALAISREVGDRRGQGNQLGNLGLVYASLGQYRRAIGFYEQTLVIHREIGNRRGEGSILDNLGLAYADLGQYGQAIEYYEQALAISREIGDRRGEGNALGNLGSAYTSLGQYGQAIEYHQQALAISREIGDRCGEGNDLGNLGLAYADLGQYGQAIEYHQQALAISREIGDRRGEGADLGNLGIAYANLGQYGRAIEYYEQALAISREIGDRRGEGNDLGNLGLAHADLGQYQRAIEYHQQALAISREIGDRRGQGNQLGNLGSAYYSLGQYGRAIEYYQQALAISREIGDRRGEGNGLSGLGIAYASLGQYERAIEYYEQARAIFAAIGVPHLVEQMDHNIALARAQQGGGQQDTEGQS